MAVDMDQGISIDEVLDEETFLTMLDEILRQSMTHFDHACLILSTSQVDVLARRLHDALVPKRDQETCLIEAWTIQPQVQVKTKSSAHIQVLKLSTILRQVERLRVYKSWSFERWETIPIQMDIFPSLCVIETLHMDMMELQYVHYFAKQLKELHIEHTSETITLKQLLAPEKMTTPCWTKLTKLQMNCCTLKAVDQSVSLLKTIRTLDLGWNKIDTFDSNVTTESLEVLNLCHNQLNIVPPIHELRRLRELDLSVNQLVSLKGLETLETLERLDISHNLIDDIEEVELLTRLQKLRYLKMEFNPIARRPDYRREVLFYLGELIELDGHCWSEPEISSMKNRRMLMILDGVNLRNTVERSLWEQFDGAPVYPRAHVPSGIVMKNPKMVLRYPCLPRSQTVPAQFVEIQNPLSTYPIKSNQSRHDGDTQNRDSTSRTFDNIQSSHGVRPSIQTVDDYFSTQRNVTVSTMSQVSQECDEQAAMTDEENTDASTTKQTQVLSRKLSTPIFTRDVEEEDSMFVRGSNDNDSADIHVTRSTPQTQTSAYQQLGRSFSVRVLLSAKEAAELDLHFRIDGVPANVEIKHQKLIEKFTISNGKDPIAITRWLPDVIAVGTSMHSNRAKIITMKLQSRGLSNTMDAAYQFDSVAPLETLLLSLITRLFQQYKSHIVNCNCANCGAISLLTPRYPERTEANDPLTVYLCLLCSSCNVREISFKKLVALCANEGIAIPSSISLAPSPREAITEGFYIEEPSATDAAMDSSMHECIMVSCNSIREVTAFSKKLGRDEVQNDEWNDAIVHAMTTSMR
ncbi:unnamed protein product [Peronospora belbahrii]|uniref:Uncharacterized protein n=1 Tax=Peronospora belbahrii TaxID=622444 RepID=A0AAU9L293_9STRA|nr:unnamed protein product [Peronospora belbahrii]CAH0517280.1 unnamed protein product [Peronospora belbahrii]